MSEKMLSAGKGALFLTALSAVSQVLGFFYRVVLSRLVGAEVMGLYQLIMPVCSVIMSLAAVGLTSAVSNLTSQHLALGNRKAADQTITTCLKLFFLLLLPVGVVVIWGSDAISVHLLGDARTQLGLILLIPCVALMGVENCHKHYFYGSGVVRPPAIVELLEQFVRVAGVWLFFEISMEKHGAISLNLVMWGMVAGELAAVLFSVSFLRRKKNQGSHLGAMRQIFFMSLPLSANRVLVNILQSMEAVMIPGQLRQFGYSTSESLSVYGILTGMALPMVLFPSVLTNSVSVMLLPAIAEAQEKKEHGYILTLIKRTCFYSLLLGFGCTMMFLFLGRWMGSFLFGNELAGTFIVILGWICPFLYLSTTLHSILNGLGKTTSTFFLNIMGLGIRIGFVLYVIPAAGIKGYLWGLLLSQSVMASGALFLLLRRK